MITLGKIPTAVWLAGLGGLGLLGYYLFKKKEFPFNEGSIFSELKNDLSNLGPGAAAGGGGAGTVSTVPPELGGGEVTPGTIQSNPSAVDMATYQNYLQGLKAAFPDYVPNISSQTGQVIAGDPNLFQNNPINGPPVQPYPGGALMPPFTQQMYPYYRAPMIPEPGSMRGPPPPPFGPPPMMPPPRGPPPMGGPPPWDDPWFDYDFDKFGRKRRKWHKPKPTATPQEECMIRVGSICIGKKGINIGDRIKVGTGGINVGGSSSGSSSGISVGGLQQLGSLKNMFGNNTNKYGVGTSTNPQVIRGQVNSMLDDVFSKVGMSR